MGNYEDAIKYLEKNKIKLFDYQKDILKAFIEDKNIWCARSIGRTYVANCYGKYIAHLLSNNDYSIEPDVIFPYTVALPSGVITEKLISTLHDILPKEEFQREYLCK